MGPWEYLRWDLDGLSLMTYKNKYGCEVQIRGQVKKLLTQIYLPREKENVSDVSCFTSQGQVWRAGIISSSSRTWPFLLRILLNDLHVHLLIHWGEWRGVVRSACLSLDPSACDDIVSFCLFRSLITRHLDVRPGMGVKSRYNVPFFKDWSFLLRISFMG